jgi:hypothetical protein
VNQPYARLLHVALVPREAGEAHGGGARSNLATFLVGQRDDNAITGATNELKRVLILAGDFVHVMRKPGNYVNRIVVSSPVNRHTLIVVLLAKHALYRLLVGFTHIHFLIQPVFRSR